MEAYIYDAVRTPRGKGKPDGAMASVRPVELLAATFNAIRDRNSLDTSLVEDAIIGCVTPVKEQGANIAKAAAIEAGYAETVAGVQVNRFCASGLEAVNMAAAYVVSGQADLIVAGGLESMSRVSIASDGGPMYDDREFIMKHGLVPQGISADLIASKYGYDRRQLDTFAADSHRKAAQAWDEGRFSRSILPISHVDGTALLDRDQMIRPTSTADTLGELRPAFQKLGEEIGFNMLALKKYPEVGKINHVHHAGNSSAIVDGAALTLIGNREVGQRIGLRPRARIRAMALTGTEPTIMLLGPAPVTRKALKKAGMNIADIDLMEVNEAFAAVVLRFMDDMGADPSRVNVNGGAIAMGHPLGATGAMLLGTVLDELERQDKQVGLVTLCVGGGMGIATIIERV
ncbi:MAG: acetyl-CoA C-acetyltransferase [Flavobacteriales bacterium]|nr:acetyl-CoA C-acetyltransferase [Flavobacteriales bacterium]